MKKILVLILCMSIMIGLTACSNANKEKNNKDKSKETKVSQETEEKETEETEEEKKTNGDETGETKQSENENSNDDLVQTYKVGGYDIYVDAPGTYMSISAAYTQMFNVGRQKSISLVGYKDYNPSSLEEAYEKALEGYVIGFQNYARIDTITVEEEEVIDINGTEMYHFEGQLNCIGSKDDYSLYCKGYSFIMDGIPCMLIGTVIDKEQPQEMIDEVKMYTDAMVQTVREAE